MGIKQMYKGIANSPQTILTKTIGATDTVIEVAGIDAFPAGPNMAVIGIDEEAETITYATKTDTALSGCKRGVEGKAKAWETDSLISRNFTNYDYDTLIENILTLDKEKTASSDFTSFKDEIIKQLGNADTENGKKYATKQELSTAETNLDNKINTKLATTTFEDFKNTNQVALDKKTNNTDFDVYKKEVTSNLAKKVDKVSGKGLSTNDYTDLEKAEVAKIKNLATNETVTGIKSDVENLKTSKVDKEVGKGLSTNDYDNTEKAEVSKIKNKADKTYVDAELADKATVTDLTKKVDKTSITSDLEGADETKVLSQKAGSLLFQNVDNGKGYIANAIIDLDKEVEVSNESTFIELGDAITNNLKAKPKIYGFEIDENNSNPKTAVTYINENLGFTPAKVVNGKINWGSWEQFVKDISYRVLVKDEIEQYKVQYDNPTKKLDGSSAILTGADGDLFTKFIPIWRKYTKTAKGYKIELSDEPFTGAKSLVNELENGYNQFNNPIMILLQDLYLLIFKDRDSQTALGKGHVSDSSKYSTTGGTNGKGYIFGETTGKLQMCFLGIEDLWGNKYQWVDGLVSDGSYNILTGTKSFNDSGSGYTKITTGISSALSGYAKTVQGGDAGYILADTAGSTSTGYCDYGDLHSGKVAYFGGYRSNGDDAGAFYVWLYNSASFFISDVGARLCFKNTEGVYVGNYLGYVESSKLRSIVGKEPTGNETIGKFRTYAQNNNN